MVIDDLIRLCVERNAGDLLLRAGMRPWWRIPGEGLSPVEGFKVMYSNDISLLAGRLSGQTSAGVVARSGGDLDFRAVAGGVPWRVNLSACCPVDMVDVVDARPEHFAARPRDLCLTLRRISLAPPPPSALDIGSVELDWWWPSDGLVMVSGVPGSGKSTVLASVIGERARVRPEWILTFESPVEHDLQGASGKGLGCIIQHDLPWDICDPSADQSASDKHYAHAMRNVLRRAADGVLLGEVRTGEVARALLDSVRSGLVVYTTIHAASAALAPARLLGMLPSRERLVAETSLRSSLRLLVHASRNENGGFARSMIRLEADDSRLAGPWEKWADELASFERLSLREVPLLGAAPVSAPAPSVVSPAEQVREKPKSRAPDAGAPDAKRHPDMDHVDRAASVSLSDWKEESLESEDAEEEDADAGFAPF